ncbi:MAG: RNA repair domain-containing protein [Bacteroidia bacterium]
MKPKPPLRSIKDIHSRLRWDGGIPTETIYIGYIDRMRGLVEIPFNEFTPNGRVPWDRIQYFRMGEKRIWDRETRMDLVFGSGDTPSDAKLEFATTTDGIGAGWQRISALRYDPLEGNWEAAPEAQTLQLPHWNTVTLNLLSNHFLPEKQRTKARYLEILNQLEQSGADLITLQEADTEFLNLLLAQTWVQRNYCVADNRHIGQERSHFEVVLSLVAPQLVLAPIIEEECRSLLLSFDLKGSRMWVLCVHLFSDSGINAPAKREAYLQRLLAQIPIEETILIQGDFNFGDEHLSPSLAEFTDCWKQLNPSDPGITYHGTTNPIAKLINPTARDRRLDRILVRSESGFPLAEEIEILPFVHSTTGEPLSDHLAVRGKLSFGGSFGSLRRAPKTHHSALTLLPPPQIVGEIQALRRAYDTTFARWMPHINVLYGFIPQPYFGEAAVILQNALGQIPAFDIHLEGFDCFEHAESTTIFLRPDATSIARLRELQAIAFELFPNCDEQNRHGAWNPHLTVAKIPHTRKQEVRQLIAEWNAAWNPVLWKVESLAIIARAGDSAFEVHEEVTLQGGRKGLHTSADLHATMGALGLLPSRWQERRRTNALQALERAAAQLREPAMLVPVGSYGLGTLLPDSDLDLLCLGLVPQEEFFTDFQRHCSGLQHARVAANALVPTLRLQVAGVDADIMYLRMPAGVSLKHPAKWTDAEIALLDEAGLRVFNAYQDLQILKEMVAGQPEAFQLAAISLKAWANAQDISGNAFGYPGGFAWSLLLAKSGARPSAEAWLAHFSEWFLEQDFSGIDAAGESVPMLLTTGATGKINITRNVSEGTLATIRANVEDALLRIWSIWDGAATWKDIFRPMGEEFASETIFEWQAISTADLEHVTGWIQSQMIALLRSYEAMAEIRSRPAGSFVTVRHLSKRYSIHLRRFPSMNDGLWIQTLQERFSQAFHEMPNRPEGAKLLIHNRIVGYE